MGVTDHSHRSPDEDDVRLSEWLRPLDLQALPSDLARATVLLSYPDDRGVRLNGGRPGANLGPGAFLEVLGRMTPPYTVTGPGHFYNAGDGTVPLELLAAHEEARRLVGRIRDVAGARLLTFGGGHDWGYPDFIDWNGPLLHFDAHLDTRPNPAGAFAGHSGTPFRRVVEGRKGSSNIHVFGLQKHCNAKVHVEWARNAGMQLHFLEDAPLGIDAQWSEFEKTLAKLKGQSVAVSLDLDVFAQSDAPGVSAPQPFGLAPELVLQCLRALGRDAHHLGIYELNPRFDVDRQTARLAARLAHEFLFPG